MWPRASCCMTQLGGAKSVPAQKHLTRAGALRLSPGLKRSSLIGGVRYYDTVVDDARHTMTVARTAAQYGAVVRSSSQVVSLLREGDRVTGVTIRDSEDGAITEVRGHVVVNATGVWTDEIQALSKQRGRFRVRASKGVHIVVPRDRIVSEVAIILRTEKSVLFVIPWGTHWIIGTTDTDWNLDLAHPAATKADIDYILGTVNTVLATPLTHDDIDGVYAGLRPLLAGRARKRPSCPASTPSRCLRQAWWPSQAASTPPIGSWRQMRSTPPPSTSRQGWRCRSPRRCH